MAAGAAGAADLSGQAELSLEVPEPLLAAVRAQPALARLPTTVWVDDARLALAALPPARAGRQAGPPPRHMRLGVRSPLAGDSAIGIGALLRTTGTGAAVCRLAVEAGTGLGAADIAALERIGPCAREIRLTAASAGAALDEYVRLRQTSVVVRAKDRVFDVRELARLRRLPQARVSITDAADDAAKTMEALRTLGGGEPALEVRAARGVLSDSAFMAARREHAWPLRIVAVGGLDPEAARDLRTLGRVEVVVALEGALSLPPDLPAAAELLRQGVAPAGAPAPAHAEASE